MSILQESKNYVWNPNSDSDCLGEGAFGKVYCGNNKVTGDTVAIKIFKYLNKEVSIETGLLQKLRHAHIIQLLAVETEKFTHKLVMVMELCNGGSLMNFLNQPENACGLSEDDFLLVLHHLSDGLEYLKRHNVIHRDVKPDNIMRHISEDDQVVYKLADFGTARELPEGENFYSLHGTEPYLNPQLFKVCFFKQNAVFGANTDLWSIGVTLYQTATGHLPFLVQDRHVMLNIYNEMARNDGIISAVQKRNTDIVIYQKTFPPTNRFSLGLKQLITPIISGLFLQETTKQWSFLQYYIQVRELHSRKIIRVFYINKMQVLNIYVKPNGTFSDFKYFVFQQSKVNEEDQVFFYNKTMIINVFDDFQAINTNDCVYLFNKCNNNVENNTFLVYQDFSNFTNKFLNSSDDLGLAQKTCRDLCIGKNLMENQCQVYNYFATFMKNFESYLIDVSKDQRKMADALLEKYSTLIDRAIILEKFLHSNNNSELEFIRHFKVSTDMAFQQINNIFDELKVSKSEYKTEISFENCLKVVLKELSNMRQSIKKLPCIRHDKKMNNLEKLKITRCVRTILDTFNEKVAPNFEHFVLYCQNWFQKCFFPHVKALRNLKTHLIKYSHDLKKFECNVNVWTESRLLFIVEKPTTISNTSILILLQKYKESTGNFKIILDENTRLLNEINELVDTFSCDFSD